MQNTNTAATQTSVSMASTHVSDLLALPAELRLQIYTYVLAEDDTVDVPMTRNAPTPALLQVSQQIRDECMTEGTYYKLNSFRLTAEDDKTAGALAFCKAAGSQLASLKYLAVEIHLSARLMERLYERYELSRTELALMPRRSWDRPACLLNAATLAWTSLLLDLNENGREWRDIELTSPYSRKQVYMWRNQQALMAYRDFHRNFERTVEAGVRWPSRTLPM